MIDRLVVGGGPAGLATAMYLARYRRNVLLIDSGHSRAELIPQSHNYPGFSGIAGTELMLRLREQHRSSQLTVAGIKIVRHPVRMDQRNDRIAALCEGRESHLLDIVYPVLGCDVRSQLGTNLGAKCAELGTLEVDAHQQTTVERVYAVGDVVTDLHQLTVATGHAAVAATNIHNRLPANFRSYPSRTLGVGRSCKA